MTVKSIYTNENNEELIDFLESLVQMAKTGEIISVAAVLGYSENSVGNTWHLNKKTYRRMIQAEAFQMMLSLATDDMPEIMKEH